MLNLCASRLTVGHNATLELQARDKYGNNRGHYSLNDGTSRIFGGANDTLTLGESIPFDLSH
jgi:hypothetical protein